MTESKDFHLKYLERKIQKQKLVFIFLGLLLILAMAGCSSIQVSQDYKPGTDFRSLKTFAWKFDDQIKTGDIRVDSTLINDRIRKATERELRKKGRTKNTGPDPDFYISYTYTISKKIDSRPVAVHTGYHGRSYRYRHSAPGLVRGAEVYEYDESLLIIDFLKPGTDTILWRGISTQFYDEHASPEIKTQSIDDTIHKILTQFPPAN